MSAPLVFCVEDDVHVREMMAETLTFAGYRICVAEHGGVALALMDACDPCLILLDLRMPVMDAWAFVPAYRRRPTPHAPIVLVSAGDDGAQAAAQLGLDGLLAKPFRLRELLAVVAAHCPPAAVP